MKFKCDDPSCTFPNGLEIRLGTNRYFCHKCKRVVITKIVPVKFEPKELTELMEEQAMRDYCDQFKQGE